MNNVKLKIKLDGLSTVERKVFNATPKQRYATAGEVMNELNRAGGNITQSAVAGILNHLSEIKVISEVGGKFKGIPFKETTKNQEPQEPQEAQVIQMIKPQAVKPQQKRTALEILDEISQMVGDLKDKLDAAAIEIADQIAASEEKSAQLKQLQSLLKAINTD